MRIIFKQFILHLRSAATDGGVADISVFFLRSFNARGYFSW
jgi:hypothetical protein